MSELRRSSTEAGRPRRGEKRPITEAALMRTIGDRVRAARAEMGLSQAALGARIGRDHSCVAHYERAYRAPSLGTLIDLATELGVTTDFLLGRTGDHG